jgi:hypothetical protein
VLTEAPEHLGGRHRDLTPTTHLHPEHAVDEAVDLAHFLEHDGCRPLVPRREDLLASVGSVELVAEGHVGAEFGGWSRPFDGVFEGHFRRRR